MMSMTPALDVVVCIRDSSYATFISHMNPNSKSLGRRHFSLPLSENSAEGRGLLHRFVSEKQTPRMGDAAAELPDSQVQ